VRRRCAEFYSGGGLSTGGEDRRTIIRQWLRGKEKERVFRDKLTFWFVLGALIVSVVGVIATILHQ
jgi:hypothetical protein